MRETTAGPSELLLGVSPAWLTCSTFAERSARNDPEKRRCAKWQ